MDGKGEEEMGEGGRRMIVGCTMLYYIERAEKKKKRRDLMAML